MKEHPIQFHSILPFPIQSGLEIIDCKPVPGIIILQPPVDFPSVFRIIFVSQMKQIRHHFVLFPPGKSRQLPLDFLNAHGPKLPPARLPNNLPFPAFAPFCILADSSGFIILNAISIAELRLLPASEKLKIIETLWSDLAGQDEDIRCPDWHEQQLRETNADFQAGREEVLDWQDAKKELRARFE